MQRKRVFIFPCGSEIGLELNRALAFSTHFEVVGGGSVNDHGSFAFSDYVGGMPHVDDPAFLECLQQVLRNKQIGILMAAHDSALLRFAQWAEDERLGDVLLVGSPLETVALARSKTATYQKLKSIISVPHIYDAAVNDLVFPLLLKPDIGQGSRGIFRAEDIGELEFYLRQNPGLIISEFLPGDEFTVDCFTDRHGELRFSQCRSRGRISNGISVASSIVEHSMVGRMAEAINRTLNFRGQWFFQVKKRASGELALLEIAPRAAGSSGLARAMGVNLPLLSLHDALDQEVEINPNIYGVSMDRALASRFQLNFEFNYVYSDLDDTLFFDGRINQRLLAVLYRFRNEGKQVYLISRHRARHKESALDVLRKEVVDPCLFKEIIEVTDDARKSDFIDSNKAIFIDDSHAERSDVARLRKIPVFDINQILEIYGDFH